MCQPLSIFYPPISSLLDEWLKGRVEVTQHKRRFCQNVRSHITVFSHTICGMVCGVRSNV